MFKLFPLLLGSAFLATYFALKVRYMSVERPALTYVNAKYFSYANLSIRRYSHNPINFVDLHFYSVYTFHNNVTINFYFYQLVGNTYKRGFIDMHFKVCDVVANSKFFGASLANAGFNVTCPYPAGPYHLYNMSIPVKNIPKSFPISKGRLYVNVTISATDEFIAGGYADVEFKEARMKISKN